MKSGKTVVTLGAILLLGAVSVWAASTPLGKAVPRSGNATLNGTAVTLETTVFSGDSLATPAEGLAVVQLPMGDQVHFGPATSATLHGDRGELVVGLERGMILARTGKGQRISVNARGIVITPTDAGSYEVAISGGAIVVAARQGAVEVSGTNQSMVVPSGKVMKFELTTETLAQTKAGVGSKAIAPGAAAAIAIAVSVGVGVPVGWAVADNLADNAREDAEAASAAALAELCQEIKSGVSPSSAAAGITCP